MIKLTDKKLVTLALIALAIELGLFFSNLHFLYRPYGASAQPKVVAKVEVVDHLARSRSPIQLSWTQLSAGDALHEGDEIATMDSSHLTVRFEDGQTVTLGPNSLLELKRIRKGGDGTFNIALLHGNLDVAGSNSVKKGQLEIQVGGQKLIAGGGSTVKVDSSQAGAPKIAVSNGQVQVTNAIDLLPPAPTVSGLGGGHIGEGQRPRIRHPLNARLELSSAIRTVLLQWDPGEPGVVDTLVEIATDPDFETLVVRRTFSGITSFDFVPEHKGAYYWRVTRRMGSRLAVSDVARFEVTRHLAVPALKRPRVFEETPVGKQRKISPPILKSPVVRYPDSSENTWGEKIFDWFFPSAQADEATFLYQVELNWDRIEDAKAYAIQIAADPNFKELTLDTRVEQTSFVWKTDAAGEFFWRVASVDSDGDRGRFSEYSTFRILAQRNIEGDESTYDTYALFDDYTRRANRFSFYFGPEYFGYFFVDTQSASGSALTPYNPLGVENKSSTYFNLKGAYERVLSPGWSLQASLRTVKDYEAANDYAPPPEMGETTGAKRSETDIFLGMEHRFFYPRHYFTIQAGVRAYFVDILTQGPQKSQNLTFSGSYTNFGFFGIYALGGYHVLLGSMVEASLSMGGTAQTSGDSSRNSQLGILSIKDRLVDTFSLGVEIDQEYAGYNFRSSSIAGDAHTWIMSPMVFTEFKF